MDRVIAGSGIDAVIYRVSKKAGISEEAATAAVDEVLTAVKDRLPPAMAAKLVKVVAGEDTFSNWRNMSDKLRNARAMGNKLSRSGMVALSDHARKIAVHAGELTKGFAARAAEQLAAWWHALRAQLKKKH